MSCTDLIRILHMMHWLWSLQ